MVDKTKLTAALEASAERELHATAGFSASEAFNMGRGEQARQLKEQIVKVISSALLDDNTCPYCADLDGQEWPADEVDWDNQPPYGNCEGADRCRCVWVYVFKEQLPTPVEPVQPVGPAPTPRTPVEGPTGEKWAKTLTPSERDVLEDWSEEGFRFIRDAQLAGIESKELVALKSALKKDGSYNGTVWRGLRGLTDADYKKMYQVKSLRWKAFASASMDEAQAASFALGKNSVMFKIKNKTGVDISKIVELAFEAEKEVILMNGAKYEIISRKVRTFETARGIKFKSLQLDLMEVL